MKFRSVIFWIHLVAGTVAGCVIFIMSVTGVAIAFEKEILDWADRGRRTVAVPPGQAERLSLDALREKFQAAQPGVNPSGVTLHSDPAAAVRFSLGRTNVYYVNPYTGEIREQDSAGIRTFLRTMTDWHRWLGQSGDGRAVGKAITGACNTAFLFLALSGLYLWWPRKWNWTALRGVIWPSLRLRGRARDWNWHNAIGFWSAPVLVVLTASALVISYRWASDLVYRAAGEKPPGSPGSAPSAAPASTAGAARAASPESGTAQPLGPEALLAFARTAAPNWEQMTLRLEPTGVGARGGTNSNSAGGNGGPRRERPSETRDAPGNSGERRRPSVVNISVREHGAWPLFGQDQYQLDPYAGTVLRREVYADGTTGRKVRSWLRFLHTGEALGVPGKTVAAAASLGGAFLVWTGFALAWRRFQGWRRKPAAATTPAVVPESNSPA